MLLIPYVNALSVMNDVSAMNGASVLNALSMLNALSVSNERSSYLNPTMTPPMFGSSDLSLLVWPCAFRTEVLFLALALVVVPNRNMTPSMCIRRILPRPAATSGC